MLSEKAHSRQSLATYLVLLLGLTAACTEKVGWKSLEVDRKQNRRINRIIIRNLW